MAQFEEGLTMHDQSGTLYVVATPIGNLDDMSQRVRSTLSSVDCILAEDTRHSGRLLSAMNITTPVQAFHDFNEASRVEAVIERLQNGEEIALISDAGTPLISDPGYKLVVAAHTEAIRVCPVPGPCALVAALCVAGLPTDRFCFEGFLPAKSASRVNTLKSLANETRTMIFYESPHRIEACIADMIAVFGRTRPVTLAREITKLHETVLHGTLATLSAQIEADSNQARGEIVLVVKGCESLATESHTQLATSLLTELLPTMPVKQAVQIAVKIIELPKNQVYQMALELQKQGK